jgi:predicted PurR-regulated permease PerM
MSRLVSFFVLIAIVAIAAFLSFEVLSAFFLPLFLALLLVVMFRPVHLRLVKVCKGRNRVAAGLTTLLVMLIGLLPLLWLLTRAATETVSLIDEVDQDTLLEQFTDLRRRLALELPPERVRRDLTQIESMLHALREKSPSAPTDTIHRQQAVVDLLHKASELKRELSLHDAAAGGGTAGASPELIKALDEFQKNANALYDLAEQPDELAAKAATTEASLERIRELIYGGQVLGWLKQQVNFDRQQLADLRSQLAALAGPLALNTTQVVGGFVLELVVGVSVMLLALYYFLADGPEMVDTLMKLTPLDSRYEVQLLNEFGDLARAILVAMLLSAFVQGLLAGVAYFFLGFESVFLFTVLTMLAAIVPFIGAMPVWGLCSLWLYLHDGRPQAAIVLVIYSFVIGVIGDNVIKPLVLHGRSNLHPLLALLSVFGGAQVLGPIGIVVGPMVVAILQTLLTMLKVEMKAMDTRGQTVTATTTVATSQE